MLNRYKKSRINDHIKGILILTAFATLVTIAALGFIQFYRIVAVVKNINPQQIDTFRIYPRTRGSLPSGTPVEFKSSDSLVENFFYAVQDIRLDTSNPGTAVPSDRLWRVEFNVTEDHTIIRMDCSFDSSGTVSGSIDKVDGRSRESLGIWPYTTHSFQSQLLIQWYKKHSGRWLAVRPILKSVSPGQVTSFQFGPDDSGFSTYKKTDDLHNDTDLIIEFFQAIEDVQLVALSAPSGHEIIERWKIQIHTNTTTVTLSCFIRTDIPYVVQGYIVDSYGGSSHFRSRLLFLWYQKYKKRRQNNLM